MYAIDSVYFKPSEAADFFVDVGFEVAQRHVIPGTKKRVLGKGGNNSAVPLYADDAYLRYLKDVGRYRRRPVDLRQRRATMQVFVVDVLEGQQSADDSFMMVNDELESPAPLSGGPSPSLSAAQSVPKVIVYGLDVDTGASVCLHIHNVFPYFVIECPKELLQADPQSDEEGQRIVDRTLKLNSVVGLIRAEYLRGETIMDFDPNHNRHFLKLSFQNGRAMNAAKSAVDKGQLLLNGTYRVDATIYECTVPYILRWMVDKAIVGCGCIRVDLESAGTKVPNSRISRCGVELVCDNSHITAVEDYDHIPDELRIISLDIECISSDSTKSRFPQPDLDPIIQISTILTSNNTVSGTVDDENTSAHTCSANCPAACAEAFNSLKTRDLKFIFTLDTCAAIPGAIVVSFQDERCMLSAWRDTINILDPDVLVGYNFINFDLWYIIERSRTLDVPNLRNLSRSLVTETRVRDSVLQSKQMGTHESKDINIDGRIQYDIYDVIRREHKLKSYSLNNVSSHFLKEQKEDVHYSQMSILQQGTAETRKRIAVYCIKDSYLVIRLMKELSLLVNIIEMARVTGVPINLLMTRGQQIKVTSQLLRKCRQERYFMPVVKRSAGPGGPSTDVNYEGATVLEPLRGYYDDHPIAVLDFASLYPSIMIAHNLCYCTHVADPSVLGPLTEGVDYELSPANKYFITSTQKRGVLPMIVDDLLSARRRVKKLMKQYTPRDLMYKVLDGRQLALKVSANSVYGYTGAVNAGQLPLLAISESITSYGRTMIEFTKQQVEGTFTRANGYAHDATVIYGDTDSVMINFGHNLTHPPADEAAPGVMEQVFTLARDAADLITAKFKSPIKLEFEKVFNPFLLMQKKRYAGLKWTDWRRYDSLDCKGIETVRRDICLLVQRAIDDSLTLLLVEKDVARSVENIQRLISDLLLNKIDISYLILSKTLSKDDSDYGNKKLIHVELVKKLRKRAQTAAAQPTGSGASNTSQTNSGGINIGDRVYFVVVAGYKGQPLHERAEDPLYVLENNLPIDHQYYLDQIKNSILRIYEPMDKKVASSLFVGPHMMQKKGSQLNAGATGGLFGLSGFVEKGLRCMSCRAVIKQGCFCGHCLRNPKKINTIIHEKHHEFQLKKTEHTRLWTECQRCQESLHKDVLCVNQDCPIFYRRIKVRKDLIQLANDVINPIQQSDPLDW